MHIHASVTKKEKERSITNTEINTLRDQLLSQPPQSKATLERLLAHEREERQRGAFARVVNGQCAACQITVATARLQRVKAGEFINCANCARFLYYQPSSPA